MHIDHTAFFNGYRSAFGRLKQGQVTGIELLGRHMETDSAITDLRWSAYMLATVKHECSDTWQPIVERGPRSYFDQYETGTAKGTRLGNTQPGDGYRYRGRGYVQITGRGNYARLTSALGTRPRRQPRGRSRAHAAAGDRLRHHVARHAEGAVHRQEAVGLHLA